MRVSSRAIKIGAMLMATLLSQGARAQDQAVADFYKGKTIDVYTGYTVGGAYDVYARLVSRFIGKYIPGNPTIVPRNMEGAGSLRLANWLYQIALKDGTAIGTFGRGAAFDPLLGVQGAAFDATKYNWIGSANDEVSVCVAWHTSGITTIDEVMTKELIVGGTGGSADTDQFPKIMNGVIGTKMKLIVGYPGGNDVNLAMQRGEVRGRCGWSWSSVKATQMQWVRDKTIAVLVQLALAKHPDLPDVPLVMDLAKTDEQKQILKTIFARQVMGRPYAAPPGVPKARVEALRKAFDETMKDKEFLAEADKIGIEITPVSGEKIQDLVVEVYKVTTPAIAKKIADMLK